MNAAGVDPERADPDAAEAALQRFLHDNPMLVREVASVYRDIYPPSPEDGQVPDSFYLVLLDGRARR
jgi:hypothetical protein